jgi:hypothetical protein
VNRTEFPSSEFASLPLDMFLRKHVLLLFKRAELVRAMRDGDSEAVMGLVGKALTALNIDFTAAPVDLDAPVQPFEPIRSLEIPKDLKYYDKKLPQEQINPISFRRSSFRP